MTAFSRASGSALLALLALPVAAGAQDIGSSLETLARENGEPYVAPVFEGLGNALNAGFLRSPDVHDRLGFDFGVRAMVALVPDGKKTFSAIPPSNITATYAGITREYASPYAPRGGSLETPTAVGEGQGLVLEPTGPFRQDLLAAGENPDDYTIPFPEGFDLRGVPFGVLTAGVGLGGGLEVTARFIPSTEVDEEVGSVSAFGLGVTHQLNRWFLAPIPVDLAVFGGFQSFDVGEYLSASTTTVGASVGKGLGPLSIFAFGQYESPSVDVEYTVSNPTDNPGLPDDGTRFAFSPDLGGSARLGAGAQLDLLILQLAGNYSTGDYDAVTARVSFSFR